MSEESSKKLCALSQSNNKNNIKNPVSEVDVTGSFSGRTLVHMADPHPITSNFM